MNTTFLTFGAAAILALATGAHAVTPDVTLFGDATANGSLLTLTTAGDGEAPLSAINGLWIDDLEAGLGVSPLALGADAFEGSAVQYTFTLAAGNTLSFNWSLSTDTFDANYADRAFAAINGDVVQLGTVQAGLVTGSFSRTFANAGDYTLSLGVVDVNDVTGVSTLHVSAVTAVPEPETFAMLLVGLGLVGAAVRRRQNAV